jgi:signal transduction histidine kinase
MRSIRRSLLGYLLVLVALALGGVVVFVDRFANAAITAREEAEVGRTEQIFELRRVEAKTKFDAELVPETRVLRERVQSSLRSVPGMGRGPGRGEPSGRPPDASFKAPDEEAKEYRRRAAALLQGATPFEWPTVAAAATIYRTSSPAWSAYEAPRLVARLQLQDALRRAVEEEEHPGFGDYYQIQLVAYYHGQPGQTVALFRSPKLGQDLPLDLPTLEQPNVEFHHDDVTTPSGEKLRRVMHSGWRYFYWVPSSLPGGPGPGPGGPGRGFRVPDVWIRLVVHHARPYSQLDTRLAADQQRRDEQLDRVRGETQTELTRLRTRLGMIGLGSFVALVVGGWVIVARGLAPIRKLSDAVSRVSEKDFRLSVRQDELSGELVPILARLTQTLDLLRQAFAREKQAVADISHELRTPIASLLATIDVSLRKPRTPDQYRATLEDCRAIARQLGQLVERIMTLATLDAGNARTAVTRADAADLAAGCARTIRPLAEHHGLAFALHAPGPEEPVELDTDADKLREVLMNLLHNAVEYNRPGGRVELTVRRDAGNAVFEVRDTGIGMPPDVRDRIFERFYRADPSRHATGVHAGLGLAIVKEYVDRLGGTIAVESAPDEGSTFRVTVPAAPPLEPDAPTEDARPDPRARGEVAPTGS